MLKVVLRNERAGAGTRRNGRSGSPSSMHRDMVGQRRQQRVLGAERRPVGAEVEALVGMAEAVEEMPGLEAGPAIEPDALLERLRPGQAAGLASVASMISHAVISKPRWLAPSRFARSQITSWFARHSAGGNTCAADLQKVWPPAV